ncbi:hypothetical protein HY493_05150 [Candidatus Woesearchaeota archaeon]|nr:hypothetical protein [Candidatus Woesearchaeota archaeon]
MSDKGLGKIVTAEMVKRAEQELNVRRIVTEMAAFHYARQGYNTIQGDGDNFDLKCYDEENVVLFKSVDAEDGPCAAPLLEARAGLQLACNLHRDDHRQLYAVLMGFGVTPSVAETLRINSQAWSAQGEIIEPVFVRHENTLEFTYRPLFNSEQPRKTTRRVLETV